MIGVRPLAWWMFGMSELLPEAGSATAEVHSCQASSSSSGGTTRYLGVIARTSLESPYAVCSISLRRPTDRFDCDRAAESVLPWLVWNSAVESYVTAALVGKMSHTNRYSVCAAARPSLLGIRWIDRTSSLAI